MCAVRVYIYIGVMGKDSRIARIPWLSVSKVEVEGRMMMVMVMVMVVVVVVTYGVEMIALVLAEVVY